MIDRLDRSEIFPETSLPDVGALIDKGRALARVVGVGKSPFLAARGFASEAQYKRRRAAEGALMMHAQIGYRDLSKSRRAWFEIHNAIDKAGGRVDRYGICLDWGMGYPVDERAKMPKGTGLLLSSPEDFVALTSEAPVAPHFGDFVIGMPSAVENAAMALAAGATSIGNLGQYFTFRIPGWTDDLGPTAATVEAIAFLAAQPIDVIVHSNIDDGFAALFHDLACSLGTVLIERYIVEDLLGGHVSHCFGNTFSEPLTRLAFQRALGRVSDAPGTMIYGSTVLYEGAGIHNYAALNSYLLVDIVGQMLQPTGHALNPVPITEAERIPDIDEIIDAHLTARRLCQLAEGFTGMFDLPAVDAVADQLVEGATRFKSNVIQGLSEAGVDIANPFELLLSLRRVGPRRLELLFGPGAKAPEDRRRSPIIQATTIKALETAAMKKVRKLDPAVAEAISGAGLVACVGATDVHEYGKVLIEEMLTRLGVRVIDLGVHAHPTEAARRAAESGADFLAISTYNGIALDYVQLLRRELAAAGLSVPFLIGGRLNQIPDASNSSLPVDVAAELAAEGATVCTDAEDMFTHLTALAARKSSPAKSQGGKVKRDAAD